MLHRFLPAVALLLTFLSLTPAAAQTRRAATSRPARPSAAQATPREASLFTTYTYVDYTIYDKSSGKEPIKAEGVSGTLALRPDGTYAKRMQVLTPNGPVNFDQDGSFTFSGNTISFSYTDGKGQPRTDNGTFRLNTKPQRLVITIEGFPAGNRGVYTLLDPNAAD